MTVLTNLLLMAAATLGLAFPLVAVREVAHALAARALGFRVHRLQLGSGKPLVRLQVAGLPVVIGRVPVGGCTFLGNTSPGAFRPRLVSALAAGPLTMAAGMTLAWVAFGSLAFPPGTAPHALTSGLALAAFAQLFLLFGADPSLVGERRAALPSAVRALFSSAFTEGRLVELLYADRALALERGLAWDADPALLDRRDLAAPVARAWRGLLAADLEDWATARTFLAGLQAELVGHPLRVVVANFGAWAATRLDDPAAWAAADADSAVALQLAPAFAAARATRAEVLVRLGRADEAIALLDEVLARPQPDPATPAGVWTGPAEARPLARSDRAGLLCASARVQLALGDRDRAVALVRDARAVDPDCAAIGEIERRLASLAV